MAYSRIGRRSTKHLGCPRSYSGRKRNRFAAVSNDESRAHDSGGSRPSTNSIGTSILGITPFTLLLPYASLVEAGILSVLIGGIMASAFSAILVYATELVPGNVGMIAGLFFGLAFGMGGIGSAALGALADHTSIYFVFQVCSFLPLLGMLTWFLPNVEAKR